MKKEIKLDIIVEYSTDGKKYWYPTYSSDAKYVRYSFNGGRSWTVSKSLDDIKEGLFGKKEHVGVDIINELSGIMDDARKLHDMIDMLPEYYKEEFTRAFNDIILFGECNVDLKRMYPLTKDEAFLPTKKNYDAMSISDAIEYMKNNPGLIKQVDHISGKKYFSLDRNPTYKDLEYVYNQLKSKYPINMYKDMVKLYIVDDVTPSGKGMSIDKILDSWNNDCSSLNDILNKSERKATSMIVAEVHEIETWDNGSPIYICPACYDAALGHDDNYCCNCGQKLEWMDGIKFNLKYIKRDDNFIQKMKGTLLHIEAEGEFLFGRKNYTLEVDKENVISWMNVVHDGHEFYFQFSVDGKIWTENRYEDSKFFKFSDGIGISCGKTEISSLTIDIPITKKKSNE